MERSKIIRLHTFSRGRFTVWADRVPAIFGSFNLFTLWEEKDNGITKHGPFIGGGEMRNYVENLCPIEYKIGCVK